jgi:hypothetical protein
VSACTRKRAALLRLDLGLELLVLDLLVAFESDAVDDRVFDDREDQPAALHRRANVLEQAGGVERLHAFIDLECIESAARARPEIGPDGVGFDALIALDDDGIDGRRLCIGDAYRERHDTRTRQHTPEHKAGNAQPSYKPSTKCHSPHALCRPL